MGHRYRTSTSHHMYGAAHTSPNLIFSTHFPSHRLPIHHPSTHIYTTSIMKSTRSCLTILAISAAHNVLTRTSRVPSEYVQVQESGQPNPSDPLVYINTMSVAMQ